MQPHIFAVNGVFNWSPDKHNRVHITDSIMIGKCQHVSKVNSLYSLANIELGYPSTIEEYLLVVDVSDNKSTELRDLLI